MSLVLSFYDQHKIQFFSLSCHFLIFAFKTYVSLKKFLLSAQDSFYIILSSYVEGHVKKIKSEFHVFGWFPGLQNLEVFLEKLLRSKF